MIEIERKFLVDSTNFKNEAYTSYSIKQGFLNKDKNRTVRVRIKEDTGYITVKGRSSENGLSRFEWEKEISLKDAEQLLNLCEKTIIDKTRYEVKCNTHIYEIDEFYGANKGLIIAEIELNSETEAFETPDWLGKEVTCDPKYYNSQLSKNPYNNWK